MGFTNQLLCLTVSVPFSSEEDRYLVGKVNKKIEGQVSVPFSSEEDRYINTANNYKTKVSRFSSFFLRRGSLHGKYSLICNPRMGTTRFQFLFPPKRIVTSGLSLEQSSLHVSVPFSSEEDRYHEKKTKNWCSPKLFKSFSSFFLRRGSLPL